MKNVVAFLSGLLFALGLGLAGMTRPTKVLGFLELRSGWDPSLLFVMVGGIAVYALGYWLIQRQTRPLLDSKFYLPVASALDRRLIIGAAIFGIGWGLGGFCPGPGFVSAATGGIPAVVFTLSMLSGMFLFRQFERHGCRVHKLKG